MNPENAVSGKGGSRSSILVAAAILLLVLLACFYPSLREELVLFCNDAPLGALVAYQHVATTFFTGTWHDLNWIGLQDPSALPNLTYGTYLLWGPVAHAKFFVPLALLLLGLSSWWFFRRLRFAPPVCILGALALMLNTSPFSWACWGLPYVALTMAACFTAFALLTDVSNRKWLRLALAGFAVGMGVMEGYDTGAIFSLYAAAFTAFAAWVEPGQPGRRAAKAGVSVALVAVCAALIAAHAVSTLVTTQIKAVAGSETKKETAPKKEDAAPGDPDYWESKQGKWDLATAGSLPKLEILRVIIPGVFGYRMDTPGGGNYWGKVGYTPSGLRAHSGSGVYCGVLVVLVALWGVVQSFRKKDATYSDTEKRWIWFWTAAAVVSLLLAFGRHAMLYWLLYKLPFFSTIRLPIKFMHPFSMCLVILFAYALQGLWRQRLERARAGQGGLVARLQACWAGGGADRSWLTGCAAFLVASMVGWLMYASSRRDLVRHLEGMGYDKLSPAIAQVSLSEAGWFVVFLSLSILVLAVGLSGVLSGAKAKWMWLLLGALLLVDFGRANAPWIQYYDYKEKYASNPVMEVLRDQPHTHRATILPFQVSEGFTKFQQFFYVEWLQNLFPYFRIQATDVIQMPRAPADKAPFDIAFSKNPARLWQLTNTRLFFGVPEVLDGLNAQLDPGKRRFKLLQRFNLAQHGATGVTAQLDPAGALALIEFDGALPRAKWYGNWETPATDDACLARVVDPQFEPFEKVLISSEAGQAVKLPALATNAAPGTVEYTHYEPKKVTLKTQAAAAGVVLLNDRYDPGWNVYVDGAPAPLLRCNYWMRGVAVESGAHTVEFRFEPPHGTLYVSLAAIVVGLAFCGLLARTTAAPTKGAKA